MSSRILLLISIVLANLTPIGAVALLLWWAGREASAGCTLLCSRCLGKVGGAS